MELNQEQYDFLQTQKPPESPQDIYADTMREEKITNLLSQINPDNLLIEIEYRIRGYKKNTFTGQWERISNVGKEINDYLVSDFIGFLGGIMNQSTTMSNFSNQEINSIMGEVAEWIGENIVQNKNLYGLEKNNAERNRIGLIIMMNVFSALKRAQNGMEARRIFGAMKIHESLTQNPQSKGFAESIKFWK